MAPGSLSPRIARLFEVLGHLPAPTAARHGLSAFLVDGAPTLLDDARGTISRGLKTKRLTLMVLDRLRAAGMVPTLLKGYGLATRLFPGQPLARPSTDVDVLLSPAELKRAHACFSQMGLTEVLDPAHHEHHVAFSGPPGLVEAHFKLFNGFGGGEFDEVALRARRVKGKLDEREVYFLSPEDEFLYLAVHAANHRFLRLSWLVDLVRYLDVAPLDFDLMATRALAAGLHVSVAECLDVLDFELQVDLPGPARAAFPLSVARRLVLRRLFSRRNLESAALAEDRLGSFLLRLVLVDSPPYGVRHLVEGAQRLYRRTRAGT